MRWPWQRSSASGRLVISWSNQTLCYALGRATRDGLALHAAGVEALAGRPLEDFAADLAAKGFAGQATTVVLLPSQYSLLQIAAPAVPPEELKAAARFQIRDMVDAHIDDLTIDVLHVGNGQDKAAGQIFVVAARNTAIKEAMDLAQALGATVGVVDVLELALRNLQTDAAQSRGLAQQATATFMVINPRQAVLSVAAGGELYLSRRLDLPDGFLETDFGVTPPPEAPAPVVSGYTPLEAYTPVQEYVPDYMPSEAVSPAGGTMDPGQGALDAARRVALELQRSIDLWERTWPALPLAEINVAAGPRSGELAGWLARELGQPVTTLDLETRFPALADLPPSEALLCAPLLGLLLRPQSGAD